MLGLVRRESAQQQRGTSWIWMNVALGRRKLDLHRDHRLPPEFRYTVVKLNLTTNSVSFVEVTDFDSAPEPTIDTIITVRADGATKRTPPPSDPYIYHHKWLFVKDDYDGFDVEQSKARSRAHMALADIDRRRTGKKSYWNTNVVPKLPPE